MQKSADNIIVGTVTDDSMHNYFTENVTIVLSTLKIQKVLKGNLSVGDAINIHETGEVTEQGDITIGGVPLLKKGMKVLLYISNGTDAYVDGGWSYGILGCYQGKFFYDNQNLIHPASEFSSEVTLPLSDFTQPVKEADVLTLISKNELDLQVK